MSTASFSRVVYGVELTEPEDLDKAHEFFEREDIDDGEYLHTVEGRTGIPGDNRTSFIVFGIAVVKANYYQTTQIRFGFGDLSKAEAEFNALRIKMGLQGGQRHMYLIHEHG